eukprot:TRINITY_DN8804_c0_g1_i1.p1 TRINITY_DN8804_c0_g1~~TRINITY_DN8804_c0_g1_i1.p1  ORF type:complete len:421 (+),score=123.49 TRINITY_DN8804_c0_g1_i1:14-1276(+)
MLPSLIFRSVKVRSYSTLAAFGPAKRFARIHSVEELAQFAQDTPSRNMEDLQAKRGQLSSEDYIRELEERLRLADLDAQRQRVHIAQLNKSMAVWQKIVNDHEVQRAMAQADGEEQFAMRPIGYLQSCFIEKNGTPRQGCLATMSRAALKLLTPVRGTDALVGLENYSHVWLIFVFHDNNRTTNSVYRPKVKPPRLNGMKVGVFSTRSPHRYNDIGLSLVRLERVDGDTLHLSGVDMIDGTPILDVKPYLPDYDAVPDAAIPDWIKDPPIAQRSLQVSFTDEALATLQKLLPSLKYYQTLDEVRTGIEQVLRLDIRTIHMRKKHVEGHYGFCFDTLNVVFRMRGDKMVEVYNAEVWAGKSAGALHHSHTVPRSSSESAAHSDGAPDEAAADASAASVHASTDELGGADSTDTLPSSEQKL